MGKQEDDIATTVLSNIKSMHRPKWFCRSHPFYGPSNPFETFGFSITKFNIFVIAL